MKPIELEDERALLMEHEMEVLEETLREAIIDATVLLLDPCCGPDCDDRWFYRYELRQLRREYYRVQRLNGTSLVLDSKTYDAEGGDEYAEVAEEDLDRLAWERITLPWTRPGHGMLLLDPGPYIASDFEF